MTLFQKGLSNFRTVVLGHLSPAEAEAVQDALHIVREGWPGHDNDMSGHPGLHALVKKAKAFVAELQSDDPKRQRAVLSSADLQAWLATERRRNAVINAMHYFRHSDGAGSFTAKKALEAINADSKNYPDRNFSQRNEQLLSVGEDPVRWEAVHFAKITLDSLRRVCSADKDFPGDEDVRRNIVGVYMYQLSRASDASLEERLANIESAARATQPELIAHYFDVFRMEGWRDQFVQAQRDAQTKKSAEQFERDRIARIESGRLAAEKHKQLEARFNFEIEDGALDISVRGWPRLESQADTARLFEDMKLAFSRATKLRYLNLEFIGQRFDALRNLSSMSTKQLACIKISFWSDRAGYIGTEWEARHLREAAKRNMVELLNCDGRAQIYRNFNGSLSLAFEVESQALRADLESAWSEHVDLIEKWKESESFEGQLIRWFIEDRTDNTGWATSR